MATAKRVYDLLACGYVRKIQSDLNVNIPKDIVCIIEQFINDRQYQYISVNIANIHRRIKSTPLTISHIGYNNIPNTKNIACKDIFELILYHKNDDEHSKLPVAYSTTRYEGLRSCIIYYELYCETDLLFAETRGIKQLANKGRTCGYLSLPLHKIRTDEELRFKCYIDILLLSTWDVFLLKPLTFVHQAKFEWILNRKRFEGFMNKNVNNLQGGEQYDKFMYSPLFGGNKNEDNQCCYLYFDDQRYSKSGRIKLKLFMFIQDKHFRFGYTVRVKFDKGQDVVYEGKKNYHSTFAKKRPEIVWINRVDKYDMQHAIEKNFRKIKAVAINLRFVKFL